MPHSEADFLVDRRRLKRSRSLWRAGVIVLALAVAGLAIGRTTGIVRSAHVARLTVAGVITDDPRRDRAIDEVARDPKAKALIVRIDSPGGTVVGGESLYRQLRRVSEHKPVVAVLGQTAASGGYMTALGADWIVAREGTITGSIGVVMQTADVTGLLEKLGVAMEQIKSSPLKAVPNPLEPLTDEGRRAVRSLIDDAYDMFVGMVAERRKLERAAALKVADGRVFTGRQARELGLVDQLGGEDAARGWLESERKLPKALAVRDLKPPRVDEGWIDIAARIIAATTGKSYLPERLTLDGLVALWHPDLRAR
ncbi:MAG: signal peptide peptidase SppA [Alphaproteobacteria bacterium]|nr:signal peptide peptidase SppA [Alphaproteobacteria bacterium]